MEKKFRAWDKFTKKMWQWEDCNAFSTQPGSIKDWFTDSDLSVMQFIGHTDKHGVEIYEGDFVNIWHMDDEPNEHVGGRGVIAWRESSAAFVIRDDEAKSDYPIDVAGEPDYVLEVIGNVYENVKIVK